MFTSVTSTMLAGILDEVKNLVPIVLPAAIGFLAFRKGWSFIREVIHGA